MIKTLVFMSIVMVAPIQVVYAVPIELSWPIPTTASGEPAWTGETRIKATCTGVDAAGPILASVVAPALSGIASLELSARVGSTISCTGYAFDDRGYSPESAPTTFELLFGPQLKVKVKLQ